VSVPPTGGLAEAWRRRAAELLTVFLGVALAFLAENWREDLADRRDEDVALAGLAADFRVNSTQRADRFDDQRRTLGALGHLADLLEASSDGAPVEIPDTLLIALTYSGTYDPTRGTIDALLSSGRLDLVRDAELRRALASWPSDLGDLSEKQEWQREFVDRHARPFLLAAGVSLEGVASSQGSWVDQQPGDDPIMGSTTLRNSVDFRNVVGYRRHFANLAMSYFSRFMEIEDRLLDRLEGER
jgi:hypothetical protein